MRRSVSMMLLIFTAAACAVDPPRADVATSTAYGGVTYGSGSDAGVVRFRSIGNVKNCIAGPRGVLLPNRFVSCYCDQLVKDCAQDTTCATSCSNVRTADCAQSSWFSSVSYLFGSCNVSELNDCARYCQQNCTSGCAQE